MSDRLSNPFLKPCFNPGGAEIWTCPEPHGCRQSCQNINKLVFRHETAVCYSHCSQICVRIHATPRARGVESREKLISNDTFHLSQTLITLTVSCLCDLWLHKGTNFYLFSYIGLEKLLLLSYGHWLIPVFYAFD